ncbi:MAG: hypothetical protein ACOYOB_14700 [Myxococcota bacterium]
MLNFPQLLLVLASLSLFASCSAPETQAGDPLTRQDVPSRRVQCQQALPNWKTLWEAKAAETVAASPEDRRTIITDIEKREVALQEEAFVRLCTKRSGNDHACIVGYPERRNDPTCKEAYSAMYLDLSEVLDQGGR